MDPNQQAIGFLAGWNHCIHTSSYWISLGVYLIVTAAILIGFKAWEKKSNRDLDSTFTIICCAFILGFFAFVFARPCDVGVNTSIAAAAAGHYLGY